MNTPAVTSSNHKIGIVGNPNCGKTTLFNKLTGIRQQTGNWPGVTVERKTGRFSHRKEEIELIDLPGIYSLTSNSIDEQVARDFILSGEADLIINILDASNLERSLYLTLQLLELGAPLVLGLNMMDLLEKQGISLDLNQLSKALGIPVFPMTAKKREGIAELLDELIRVPVHKTVIMPPNPLPEFHKIQSNPYRVLLNLLSVDESFWEKLNSTKKNRLKALAAPLKVDSTSPLDEVMGDLRLEWVSYVIGKVTTIKKTDGLSFSTLVDRVALNRYLGIPLFLICMYLVFTVSIVFSDPFITLIDELAAAFMLDALGHYLGETLGQTWARVLFAEGIGGGIKTVLTFIPPIGLMFLCLSLLEDSGYMARASFVADRMVRKIGLPGKAVVPLIIGFGCTVPAVMATRTLEEERDRKMTLAVAPFMSCGAKLPIYALFAAAFFPAQGQNIVFALYIIGILVALATGLLMKTFVYQGTPLPLLIELPAYQVPSLVSTLSNTWSRLRRFLFDAGKIIVIIVTCLTILNSIGTDGSFGHDNSDKSLLSSIGKTINPIFYPLGIQEDNWPATVGIFTGIFAKEAIVGTLDALYSSQLRAERQSSGIVIRNPPIGERVSGIFKQFYEDLTNLGSGLLDPGGINIDYARDEKTAAKELQVESSSFGIMKNFFDGQGGAFAYLLWILLYAPCIAAIAAIRREGGGRWTAFTVVYMTCIAWVVSTIFYQTIHFGDNPLASTGWIGLSLSILAVIVLWLKIFGKKMLVIDNPFSYQNPCESCSKKGCH